MGISNRDYYRGDSEGHGGGLGNWLRDTPVVRGLIFTNIAVFVLQLILTQRVAFDFGEGARGFGVSSLVDTWFQMDVQAVLGGQVWRLLSYAFLHDRNELFHIAMNMLVLWFFGCTLERMYGSREFLWFYLSAAVVAAIGFSLLALIFQSGDRMVGASGAVMGVFMLYGAHFPRQQVIVWFIPVEIRFLIAFYVIMDLFPLMKQLGNEPTSTGVAYAAHLSGLLYGWLYYRGGWRLAPFADGLTGGWSMRWRRATRGRHLKVFRSEDEEPVNLEAELDRILAKIHEQGSESLTDRERKLLTKASEQFKRRT